MNKKVKNKDSHEDWAWEVLATERAEIKGPYLSHKEVWEKYQNAFTPKHLSPLLNIG